MKIKIQLSRSEMKSLFGIMQHIVLVKEGMYQYACIEVLASFMLKLQRRMLNLKDKQNLTLSMAESFFLYTKLLNILPMHTIYERMVITKIVNTIYQKTI